MGMPLSGHFQRHHGYLEGLIIGNTIRIQDKRRFQRDLTPAYQCTKEVYKKVGRRFLTEACIDRTRRNGFKMKEGKFRLGGNSFLCGLWGTGTGCPEKMWMPQPKTNLDGVWNNLVNGRCPCSWEGDWNKRIFKGPFQSKSFKSSIICNMIILGCNQTLSYHLKSFISKMQ